MRAGGQEYPHLNRGDVAEWVRVFLPAVPSVTVPSLGAGDTQVLAGQGEGNPVIDEVNSLGLCGVKIEAAGDDFQWLWDTPFNLATVAPVKVYALWSSSSTDVAEGLTWKIMYAQPTFDSGAMAVPSTVLDTVIANDMCLGTAYVLQKTAAGLINPAKLDPAKMTQIICECDAAVGTMNLGTDVVFLHGIMIEYLRAKV